MKRALAGLIKLIFLSFVINITIYGDSISFTADNMKTVLARGKERTLLEGHAEILSGEVLIRGDYIEIYGEDNNYILCEGNVFVVNRETGVEVVCDKLFMDRDLDMIRIQGNAVMEDKKNELVIKGGFIENWQEDDRTIIQIGVRILKEDMVCRAESAQYFRDRDYLELSGMPLVVWKGDEYRALKINIDLENEEVEMEGDVKGEILWEEDQTDEAAAPDTERAGENAAAEKPADAFPGEPVPPESPASGGEEGGS